MGFIKRNIRKILYTVLLVVGIILAFTRFLGNNASRIELQNEEYLHELTTQRAISVDSLFEENLGFIKSVAYLYGESIESPWAEVATIRKYEDNTIFDMLRFIDASGDDYTSKGVMANLSDRDYFLDGMKGNSGITYVRSSRATGQRQIGFYTPVYYDDTIIGVMVGFYGEDYIQKVLEYELFGYDGKGSLCAKDGTILGSTEENDYDNFFDYLREYGKCSEDEVAKVSDAFTAGESVSFTYKDNGSDAAGYAVALGQTDWLIVRNFPAAASKDIINNANRNGEGLILALMALFVVYVILLVLDFVFEQRRQRIANRNSNYVSGGMSRLFENFMTLDFNTNRYEYISSNPDEGGLPAEGSYDDYCAALFDKIKDEKNLAETEAVFNIDNLRSSLADSDVTSVRVHAPNGEGDGEWYTFNFIVIRRADDGSPELVLVVSQDVTGLARKEEEEQRQLADALDTAEKASRAKTEFLFNMSHDIRTPMNAIIGYTELAKRDGVTREQTLDYIGKIDSAGSHLLALINDILEMSRIESGKLTIEPVPTDLYDVAEEVRELFSTQMSGKHIDFTVDTDVSDRMVMCDKNRLDRVVLNLISNAYKFTPEGGAVSVSLRQTGSDGSRGEYELRVKDSGIGMKPEFVSKLFTPFERERTSTVSGIQGTGLGLSITKNIVDLMGGTIDVVTEEGKGTEFTVNLSFDLCNTPAEDNEGESGDADDPGKGDFSNMRLLLADDNEINREIATLILAQAGFSLETAENGRIAVDKVASSAPGYYDAVLMDIQMPVMNGYEATREIRSLGNKALASIPVIAMTANAFREDVQAAEDAGMNGHIAKPINVNDMMETLSRVLLSKKGRNGK